MEINEDTDEEQHMVEPPKTLPSLRFNKTLGINNGNTKTEKEPFGYVSADRYFKKAKLPPLDDLIEHENRNSMRRKKKKKKEITLNEVDKDRENSIVDFKDSTIVNRNIIDITYVQPNEINETSEQIRNFNKDLNGSNSSTETYTVKKEKQKPSRQASTDTYILNVTKKEEHNVYCGDETHELTLSEDSLSNALDRNDSTKVILKPDYRKIALDIATNPKVKVKGKRENKYCDFVLVHDLESNDVSLHNERTSFEKELKKDGLDIVRTTMGSKVFVEIYATFHRLCKEAENIYLNMDLKGLKLDQNRSYMERMFRSMETDNQVDRISAPFCSSSKEIFFGIDNQKTFFRTAYRSMLVRNILKNTKIYLMDDDSQENSNFRDKNCACAALEKGGILKSEKYFADGCHYESGKALFGIDSLLHSGCYKAAYILHDRSALESQVPVQHRTMEESDLRQELHDTWLKFTKFQPLWKIRNYFGEKIALYFAWIGVLTTSLWIPSLLGIILFIYGTLMVKRSGETFSVSKIRIWMTRALDNEITPYFALIICLWGSVFLEFWKRTRAELAYKWDVDSFEEQEPNRPQFYGTKLIKDPITGTYEPHYPLWRKILKSMGSLGIIFFMVVLVVTSVVSVVVYKVVSRVDWFSTMKSGSLASSLTSSVLNTISILLLGVVYKWLAYKLTNWENHRTRTQYEDSLTMKLFGFQFVNSYCSLFYIAFFRAETTSEKGIMELGSKYTDSCGEDNDCMSELTLQVAVLMILKPMPKFFSDIVVPFMKKRIKACFRSKKSQVDSVGKNSEPYDEDLEYEQFLQREYKKPPLGDFTLSEYTEKVIQYGYLMLFAAAFPLAPLIALITNAIDLRVDARRMLWFNQRPVPQRAQDIGIWFNILSFLNYAGMISNAFILGITSRFGRNYIYETFSVPTSSNLNSTAYPYPVLHPITNSTAPNQFYIDTGNNVWIIVIFENIVLAVKLFLQYVIPDVPESVCKAKKQEKLQLELLLAQSGLKGGPGKTIRQGSPKKTFPNQSEITRNTAENPRKLSRRQLLNNHENENNLNLVS